MSQNADHHNKTGLIAFIFSLVLSLAVMGYVSFLHPGVELDTIKESIPVDGEQAVVDSSAQPATAAFNPAGVAKPWEYSSEMAAYGKTVFALNCVACHGKEGKGDGPAAAAITPPPRNLVEGKWKQGGTTQALFETTSKGVAGTSMASFAHLSKVDRWALVHFIRSITQSKPDDNIKDLEAFAAGAE